MSTHPIFLNYRCIEAKKDAQYLYRELLKHFPEQIFMDAPGTVGGQDFPDLLKRKLQECRVLVAVIGPEWHRLTDGSGRVRLQQEDDWVRLEIATALQRGIPVIPALIDGAKKLQEGQVPPVLHGLLKHQFVTLDLENFHEASIEKLCSAIRLALKPEPNRREIGVMPAEPVLSFVKPAWAVRAGQQDEFATPWADIEIGGVVQRMRWIEPGSFWMGSDPGDPGGDDDEKPRHRVMLTKGFWLADTACTQALWEVVTGQNPSGFKGDADLPVDCVSWYEVTKLFLPKLAQGLGAKVDLPTEAEWEFACRAGTQTPYWFGQKSQTRM